MCVCVTATHTWAIVTWSIVAFSRLRSPAVLSREPNRPSTRCASPPVPADDCDMFAFPTGPCMQGRHLHCLDPTDPTSSSLAILESNLLYHSVQGQSPKRVLQSRRGKVLQPHQKIPLGDFLPVERSPQVYYPIETLIMLRQICFFTTPSLPDPRQPMATLRNISRLLQYTVC